MCTDSVISGYTMITVHDSTQFSLLQQSVYKKFVKLCTVLSDIRSLISKEDKIANVSTANNQQLGLRAAVEVSKSVQLNMCDWVNSYSADSIYIDNS